MQKVKQALELKRGAHVVLNGQTYLVESIWGNPDDDGDGTICLEEVQ